MTNQPYLHSHSVTLVSGGARGITAQCVIRLAQRSGGTYILLGRSALTADEPDWALADLDESDAKRQIMQDLQSKGEKATPARVQSLYKAAAARKEIRGTLAAVQAAGAKAEYINVDITDGAVLKARLDEVVLRTGRITGVIHGAGNLADKLIEKKSLADYHTVYSPKIDGLENILAAVPIDQLDFLVLFSSVVGFFGNVGQADYAIANETLNKYAYHLQHNHPACRVLSIDWGPWEAGMVTPELKKAFAERGVEIIPVEAGANMLAEELLSGRPGPVQLVVGTQPAFPAETLESSLSRYQIRRKLTLEANPFLFDHMIGEHAVLPATCAASWVVSACEQLYPGYSFLNILNYKVLKGIVFDETLADSYVLDLQEISKDPQGEIVFEALVWSKNQRGRTLYHYSLQVKLVRNLPSAPRVDLNALMPAQLEAGLTGKELYKNGTLFHGPSFQGVDRVLHVSEGQLVMQCVLPKVDETRQGQFIVQNSNPFIYDAIVQCLLIWAQYYYQAPCLPSSLRKFEQYKSIPFEKPCLVSMEVESQSETSVIGNITVTDLSGETYVRIEGLQGTISKQLGRFIGVRGAVNG